MEGAGHLQDLANCKALRILSEKIKNVKQFSSEACIFKVQEQLRKTKPEAYTPSTISIGPYHHGKAELRKMERWKELYTQSFLNRTQGGVGVEECWRKLKDLQGRAERYYGDLDDIKFVDDDDEFVKMLLLDGCFIVEYVIIQSGVGMLQKCIVDPIFMIQGMDTNIARDMLLLENQLPFFVLQALYDMICNLPVKPEFWKMVKFAFEPCLPKKTIISLPVYPGQEIKHLLQLVHILCQPQPQNNAGQIHQQQKACSSCCSWKQPQQSRDDLEVELCSIRTASELQEAGVHFKKLGKISDNSNKTISLFDIKFEGGVLEIPSFALYDSTETFFRNLIAYEQHSPYVHPKYFTDYAMFMDDLINTEKDVNLLRLKDVFINGLGDDKEVTLLFNNLTKEVTHDINGFYYKNVCTELNRHCKKPWNAAMAKLRRNYFHSPWAGISTFAAILLLSLAIAQTVLSALGLHK
ncbi:PREDICTED: UPF0481 protein At3g47200-like [Ipomoea nil]|uniref:UPF0481 protein At3g47200-like n=1 Tax=Ipomoea nil TaxID=35883 RepID=UPI0009019AE0|nr:PREDICTED: UPF0481 protein At3g47200-like [Ipomoea nil]